MEYHNFMTYKYCCIFIKNMQKMKSKEQNEQEPNGSTKMPSKEIEEKMRRGRVQMMNELHEKRMREYREKNRPPGNQKLPLIN